MNKFELEQRVYYVSDYGIKRAAITEIHNVLNKAGNNYQYRISEYDTDLIPEEELFETADEAFDADETNAPMQG